MGLNGTLNRSCTECRVIADIAQIIDCALIELKRNPSIGKAETDVVVAVVRVVVVPVRHIAVGSIVVPRAATVDTVVTGSRACLTFFVGNCPE